MKTGVQIHSCSEKLKLIRSLTVDNKKSQTNRFIFAVSNVIHKPHTLQHIVHISINIEHALSIHYHIDINMIQIEVDSKSVQNVPNKK